MDSPHSQSPRVGVCSWSLQPTTIADLETTLRQLGATGCQLALGPLLDDPDNWVNTTERLKAAGVSILSGMLDMAGEDYSTLESIRETGGVANDARWEENRVRAERAAGLAGDLGIDLVTFHAGFMPHGAGDPRRATLLDRLEVVARAFDARDVQLGLETGQETAQTLEGVLADVDASNLGVNFDPANMILYGMGDPVEAIERLAPYVVQVHIKDARPSEIAGQWGTEVPVGEGAVPWSAFFDALLRLPRSVDLVIEREAGAHRDDDIAQAMHLIQKHLAQRNAVS